MIIKVILSVLLVLAVACTVIQIEGNENVVEVKKAGQAELIRDPLKRLK